MKNLSNNIVVGMGEVLWDEFDATSTLGGAPANFACHAAAFISHVYLVSAVGDDELGLSTLHALTNKGVDTTFVSKVPNSKTGTVKIRLDELGNANYEIQPDAAWDHIPWTDQFNALASKCDAVCFGTLGQRSSISRQTIQRFLESTRPTCKRVFDVNLRQSFYDNDLIMESLNLASTLKLNEEELPIVCACTEIDSSENEKALAALATKFELDFVILTQGAFGSTLFHNKMSYHYRHSDRLEIRDTVGAGDAFTAAALAGILQCRPIPQINQIANQIAAFVCTQSGATPQLPNIHFP